MNKKQLIVAWIMAGLLVFLVFRPPKIFSLGAYEGVAIKRSYWIFDERYYTMFHRGIVDTGSFLSLFLLIVVVAGLLLYTLKDNKKKKNSDVERTPSKIKRIVAREGLIIFGLFVPLFLFSWFVEPINVLGSFSSGYLCYLVIRFIIWAIRTLKEK